MRNTWQIYHAQGLPIKGSGRPTQCSRRLGREVGGVGSDVGNAGAIYHPGSATSAARGLVVATVRHRGREQLRRARNYAYTRTHQDSATKDFRVYLLLRQKA